MFARVCIESLKFVRIDGAQHPRREHALKQAADPACAVPGGEISTIDAPPCGETVNVVTALESVSDSGRIRPGPDSATL